MSKKDLKITLYYSELIYDVQNKTYLTGRSRSDGNNFEAVANMQANDDDENLNQVMRSIGGAIASLRTALGEFIVETGETATNILNIAEDGAKVELTLTMPSNYNNATRDTVASASHKFIVNTAIGDWFAITNKADAADYIAMANANIVELRDAINRRLRPSRKTVNL